HAVSISNNTSALSVDDKFTSVVSKKNFPEALWSPESEKPPGGMIKDVPSGVVLRVKPIAPEPQHRLGPFPIEDFKWDLIDDKNIPWATAGTKPPGISATFSTFSETNTLRDQIRACLAKLGTTWNNISVTNIAKNPLDVFEASPVCATLGQSL